MLQLGIIRPSSSAWSSPLHMVPKKTSGDLVVTRSLNRSTIPDRYPIPHTHDFSSSLQGATVFSKLNLVRAYIYHHISVTTSDVQMLRLPLHLFVDCLSLSRFHSDSEMQLRHSNVSWTRYSVVSHPSTPTSTMSSWPVLATLEQHINDLRTVIERLSAHGIIINPNKCVFGVPELDFLGHHIDKHGITPLPEKF